jgi:23S rRNA pseudouridine1911/1915/1917 synthase
VIDRADYSAEAVEADFDEVQSVPDSCAGMRLDQVLAMLMPELSRNRLQGWIRDGRVLVDGASGVPKQKVRGGELLQVDAAPEPEVTAFAPEPIDLEVVHQDAAVLVINKPAGLVVHPGSGNWSGTLLNGLLHYDPSLALVPRAGIVHRLDKETSGLMVVARTLAAQTHLVRQLQARSVSREYLALAHGQVRSAGTVDAPIGRHPTQRTRMAVVPGAREAVTHYAVEAAFSDCTLLRCRLETGRTHQIRVHMAHLGHPLVGDPVYGRKRCANPRLQDFPRQALHARRLALIHPSSGELAEWSVPMPADMQALIDALAQETTP